MEMNFKTSEIQFTKTEKYSSRRCEALSHLGQMIPPEMEFEIEGKMISMLFLTHLTIDGTKYAVKAKDMEDVG